MFPLTQIYLRYQKWWMKEQFGLHFLSTLLLHRAGESLVPLLIQSDVILTATCVSKAIWTTHFKTDLCSGYIFTKFKKQQDRFLLFIYSLVQIKEVEII